MTTQYQDVICNLAMPEKKEDQASGREFAFGLKCLPGGEAGRIQRKAERLTESLSAEQSALYFLMDAVQPHFKIGIAKDIPSRIENLPERIDLESSFHVTCGKMPARKIEQALHVVFFQYNAERVKAQGYTEWFHVDCLEKVKQFLVEHREQWGISDFQPIDGPNLRAGSPEYQLPNGKDWLTNTSSDSSLSRRSRMIWMLGLCRHRNGHNLVNVSVQTLADSCRYSTRTVQRGLRELREKGWIGVPRNQNRDSSDYTIIHMHWSKKRCPRCE